LKDEVPTQNFFAPLRSTEMETGHGNDGDDSTEGQQQQASSNQAGKPDTIAKATEGLTERQLQVP
jgi:hypothetical protein